MKFTAEVYDLRARDVYQKHLDALAEHQNAGNQASPIAAMMARLFFPVNSIVYNDSLLLACDETGRRHLNPLGSSWRVTGATATHRTLQSCESSRIFSFSIETLLDSFSLVPQEQPTKVGSVSRMVRFIQSRSSGECPAAFSS